MDFARRAWDHSFPFDPIVRSLLDTDFYKLLMQQFIWEHYPNEQVTWQVVNRTPLRSSTPCGLSFMASAVPRAGRC